MYPLYTPHLYICSKVGRGHIVSPCAPHPWVKNPPGPNSFQPKNTGKSKVIKELVFYFCCCVTSKMPNCFLKKRCSKCVRKKHVALMGASGQMSYLIKASQSPCVFCLVAHPVGENFWSIPLNLPPSSHQSQDNLPIPPQKNTIITLNIVALHTQTWRSLWISHLKPSNLELQSNCACGAFIRTKSQESKGKHGVTHSLHAILYAAG